MEEWKAKGELLQELDVLRSRIAQFEHDEQNQTNRESEKLPQKFSKIFDNIAEGILFADIEKKLFIVGNKSICKMLGYSEEDTSNLEMTSIYSPKDSDHFIEQLEEQKSGEPVFRKDIPIMRKDGGLLYVDIISVPLTFSGKKYLINFFTDTSSRKVKSVLKQSTSLDSYVYQPLTETEIKILKSIVKGMSNKEIAQLFHRSIRTIENHRAHIMKKLRVDSSVELVKRAVTMKLVDLPEAQKKEEKSLEL
ncbi:MAG: LuxR C-terminal-related transcriptional regulator [Planctomycetota bacterium]|jgi:PAS domain S-box-containing protein